MTVSASKTQPTIHPLRSGIRWLAFIGCSIFVLWWGVTNLWVAIQERRPVELTCADYARARPSSHWLRLTGCAFDPDHIAVEKTQHETAGVPGKRKITAVYLPLHSADAPQGPARLILRSEDPDLVFLASQTETSSTAVEAAGRVSQWAAKPLEGLLHFGLDISAKEQRELAALGLALAPDYAILEHGARPYLWFALFAVLGGLLGLGVSAWRFASVMRERRLARAPAMRQ